MRAKHTFFLILCFIVSAFSVFGYKEGGYAKFVTMEGEVLYGKLEEVYDGAMVDFEGKNIEIKGKEVFSSRYTGIDKEILPSWSYIKATYKIFEVKLQSGKTETGGFHSNLVLRGRFTNGSMFASPISDFALVEEIDAPPTDEMPVVEKPEDIEKLERPQDIPVQHIPEVKPTPLKDKSPADLGSYLSVAFTDNNIEVYMNSQGQGYVHDRAKRRWTRIPAFKNVQPYFTKTSDTMALFYGWNVACVYDSETEKFSIIESHGGKRFFSFTRVKARPYVAQCSDSLALAAGTTWNAIYDIFLHRWNVLDGGADDSTELLDDNLVVVDKRASIKILNGKKYYYEAGTANYVVDVANYRGDRPWSRDEEQERPADKLDEQDDKRDDQPQVKPSEITDLIVPPRIQVMHGGQEDFPDVWGIIGDTGEKVNIAHENLEWVIVEGDMRLKEGRTVIVPDTAPTGIVGRLKVTFRVSLQTELSRTLIVTSVSPMTDLINVELKVWLNPEKVPDIGPLKGAIIPAGGGTVELYRRDWNVQIQRGGDFVLVARGLIGSDGRCLFTEVPIPIPREADNYALLSWRITSLDSHGH